MVDVTLDSMAFITFGILDLDIPSNMNASCVVATGQ